MLFDCALGVRDVTADVSLCGVDVDVDIAGELAVLVANHRRTFGQSDRGQLPERNLRAAHGRNEHARQLVHFVAQFARIPHVDRIALAAFD